MIRNIIKYFLFALFAIVIALIFVPYIYKDDIMVKLKTGLNEQLNAKVDFEDLDISLIRSFPELQLNLQNLSIHNLKPFEDELLFKSETLTVTTAIQSLFTNELILKINSLHIDNAEINLLVNKDGMANYDIMPPSEKESEAFEINFEKYELSKSKLSYADHSSNTFFSTNQLDHEGSGQIYENVYDLNTTSQLRGIDFSIDGIKYLRKANISGTALLNIDNNKQKYSFKDTKLQINELPLDVNGSATLQNTSTILDLSLASKETSFASLLSLIPNSYKGDLSKVESKGTASFNGTIKGTLDQTKGLDPQYNFDIAIKDGYAKYPGYSESISGTNAEISYSSKGAKSRIAIPQFDLKIGGDPVSGSLLYDNLTADARIKSELRSDLDLKKINDAFPLDEVLALEGQLKSNLSLDARIKDIDLANYKEIKFNGDALLNNFKYQTKDYPVITADEVKIEATPEKLNIQKSALQIGQSDLQLDGEINNPLAYVTKSNDFSGIINIKSKYINANEWISDEAATNAASPSEIDELAKSSGITLKAEVAQLDYDIYQIKNNQLDASFDQDILKIKSYQGNLYDNDFSLAGQLEGLYDYVIYNKLLNGSITFKAQEFDSNPFFETGTDQSKAVAYRVPEMLNIDVRSEVKKLIYGDLVLEDVNAELDVSDQKIDIKRVKTKGLGGDMVFSGHYKSSSKEPGFKLNYDLSNIRFDQAYSSLNIIQKLAPIMKLIDGKFNSTLSMEGNVDEKMEVLLNSLDASGFVQTVHGVINKLKPLNKLGDKLGIGNLEPLDISESKNWFKIEKGLVALQPQTHKKGNITFEVSGTHSFNQEMSYTMLATIPREELGKSTAGQVLDKGLGWLEKEADKIGVNLNQGDMITLDIKVGGSIKDPSFKITPLGSEGKTMKDQVKDEVGNKLDETKDKIKDKANEEIEKTKDSISQVIDTAVDSISNEVEEKVDTLVNEIKDKVKDEIKTKIDTVVGEVIGNKIDTLINDKIKDVFGDKAKEEADKVKDKLKDFNPFSKKKKGQ